ncbi:hypothetical protein J7E93_25735, partial [Streptomyces sp. ISL-36]|nr:hypothetical protein [Streptomyces sp. ISL-36]
AIEALAADPGIRNAPTVMAAGVQVLADAFAVMYRSASREAHRNGTTPPDTPVIDLITHTPDAGTVLYQIKTHQQRPGPPPALTGARVPEPPPPKADARAA